MSGLHTMTSQTFKRILVTPSPEIRTLSPSYGYKVVLVSVVGLQKLICLVLFHLILR